MVQRSFSCDECGYTGPRGLGFQHICTNCGFDDRLLKDIETRLIKMEEVGE